MLSYGAPIQSAQYLQIENMASSLAFFTIFSLLLVGNAIGGRKEPGEYWRDATKDEPNSKCKLGSAEEKKYPEENSRINLPTTLRENEMAVVKSADDQKAIFENSYPVQASSYDSTINDQTSSFSVAIEVKNSEEEAKDSPDLGVEATKGVNFNEKKASHSDDYSQARKKFSFSFDPADLSIYHGDSLSRKRSFDFDSTDATIYHGDSLAKKKFSFDSNPSDATIYHEDNLAKKKYSFGFDPNDATIYHEDSLAKKFSFDSNPFDATIYPEDNLAKKKYSFGFDPNDATIYHQ